MAIFNASIGFESLFVILAALLFTLFTLGIGLFICAFNVYFRDVGLLYTSLTPALFYFTKLVPDQFQALIKLNPLYHFMEMFRTILYYNQIPSLQEWGIVLGITAITFGLGLFIFKKLEKGFISNY
jgi:ABC-type polysaccharide/polyol phosphate export permease